MLQVLGFKAVMFTSTGPLRGPAISYTPLRGTAQGVGPPPFRLRQWFSGALTIVSWPISIPVA